MMKDLPREKGDKVVNKEGSTQARWKRKRTITEQEQKRIEVRTLYTQGDLALHQIIKKTGYPRSSAYWWVKSVRKGEGWKDKPRMGRRKKITPYIKMKIIRMGKGKRSRSLRWVATHLKQDGVQVTPEAIQLTIRNFGLIPHHNNKGQTWHMWKSSIMSLSPTDWPSGSLDLNPIENLWAIVENRVKPYQCHSLEVLRAAVLKEWPYPFKNAKIELTAFLLAFSSVWKDKGGGLITERQGVYAVNTILMKVFAPFPSKLLVVALDVEILPYL